MKTKCTSCGKAFDYVKYGGTCPKCGQVQLSSSHEPDTTKSTKVKNTSPASPKKKHYHITIILLIAIICVAIIPILICKKVNDDNKKALTMTTLPEPEVYHQQEAISFDTSSGPATLTITQAVVDSAYQQNTPSGYELVAIYYQINAEAESEYSYEQVPYDIQFGANPYLVTTENYYLKPLPTYKFDQYSNLSNTEMDALGISEEFEYKNGILYFLVREHDTAALRINVQHVDRVNYDAVKTLKRVIEIQDLEVDR